MANRAVSTEPEFRSDTPDLATRRKVKSYEDKVAARAIDLLENDPEITTMREARKAAREQLEIEAEFDKGNLDDKGRPTRQARRRTRPTPKQATGRTKHRSATASRKRSSRSRGGAKAVRKVKRAAIRPFGSAVSAGWTFVGGALSLILLYVALQEAGAISAFTDGISTGFRRLGDPYTPLVPTKGESSPPPPTRTTVRKESVKR